MQIDRITQQELSGKGVLGLPDAPGLATQELQRKFDEIALDVLVPHHNSLADALEDVYTKEETVAQIQQRVVDIGAADMTRAEYDINEDGVVDDSERLGGLQAAEYLTKTVYDTDGSGAVEDSKRLGGLNAEDYATRGDAVCVYTHARTEGLNTLSGGGGNNIMVTLTADVQQGDAWRVAVGEAVTEITGVLSADGQAVDASELAAGTTVFFRLEGTTLNFKPGGAGLNYKVIGGTTRPPSKSRNLVSSGATGTTTMNGVTFTRNADGSITMQGTVTAEMQYFIDSDVTFLAGETVTMSGSINNVYMTITEETQAGIWVQDVLLLLNQSSVTNQVALSNSANRLVVRYYFYPGVATNATAFPMIEYGTQKTDYVPYSMTENTIWVNTSTPITGYIITPSLNSGFEGRVRISTGSQSPNSFNAIKSPTNASGLGTNVLWMIPLTVFQHTGGAWTYKTSQIYQNGKWSTLGLVLYSYGAGGTKWQARALGSQPAWTYQVITPTLELRSTYLAISAPGNPSGSISGTVNLSQDVDLTNVSMVKMVYDKTGGSYGCYFTIFNRNASYSVQGAAASAVLSTNQVNGATVSINTENLRGNYDIGIAIGTTGNIAQSINVYYVGT